MEFEYVGPNTKVKGFLPIPKQLIGHLAEFGITNATTLLLYGLILDRAMLSQKNRWIVDGKIFIRYPVKAMARDIHKCESTVKKCLSELDSKCLIERKRDGYNMCSRIFVRIPVDDYTTESRKSDCQMSDKTAPNNYKYKQNKKTKYECGEDESL